MTSVLISFYVQPAIRRKIIRNHLDLTENLIPNANHNTLKICNIFYDHCCDNLICKIG